MITQGSLTRRTVTKSVAFLASAFVLSLIPAKVPAQEVVRLAQNRSPISGVTIIAQSEGFFQDQGLEVKVSDFTSGKRCLEAVIGGGADIATTAEAPTTAAAMAKQDIAFLARTEYSDLKTLTSVESGISDLSDLQGKRIAFTAGTGSEVYTVALLAEAGMTKDDVELVNLSPEDMLPALSSGSIDAYNTWEPHISNGLIALGDQVVELDTSGIYSETFNIVTMTDYAENNPEVIQSFLQALIQAEEWMKANPEEAISTIAEFVGMERDTLASIWNDYIFEVVLDQKTMDILNAHASWRLDSGNHPPGATMPDFMTVIYPEPLRSITPERIKIEGI